MSNQVTYTLDQKYHIVVWSHKGYSYKQINDLFSKMFENKPAPSPNTIQRILENLRRYGCLVPKNHKRERKVRPIDPERERRNRRICECVEANPTLSLKEIAKEVGTSSVTVAKVLRTNKYQQYKIDESKGLMLLPVRPKAKCKLENIIKSEPDEITQTTETTRSTNHQETTSSDLS
ncbi:uncharacterized protein LOC109599781 isoform X2 [Aethina tumida]|uniref:uncharacterized protein LOC109599781 isoform X2 n=1 Tax=Aethina tumida TaxID=116153 RepID=UPI00214875BF|nr:uncharacterized protein LOC109599781 isoform X2 [Aethina tumida]